MLFAVSNTLEFASIPRCAIIIFENCLDKSTFDASRPPETRTPIPLSLPHEKSTSPVTGPVLSRILPGPTRPS